MKKNALWVLIAAAALSLTSCVASRKYVNAKLHISDLRADSMRLSRSLEASNSSNRDLQRRIDSLNHRMDQLIEAAKSQIANQKNQLSSSEQKIAEQQQQLAELQEVLDKQRAVTERLHQSISRALMGFNSDELSVSVKNGKVYVSLQEKLLFQSGSARVDPRGKEALAKVAQVLNANPDIRVDIEGHTDSIPIKGRFQDNWDLSLARSASVVRILTESYQVDPRRVIASGHSKYDPVDTNTTEAGRAHNRRTDIVLSPNLDELYQLVGTSDPAETPPPTDSSSATPSF